jgi:hypothetical protein
MNSKRYLTSALVPPVGACRYGCGTNCAAPVTVFWLFGVVSVVYGFLGGPTAQPGISWYTVGLGLAMWALAAVWTMLTLTGVDEDRCQGRQSTQAGRVDPLDAETNPFDEVRKAH